MTRLGAATALLACCLTTAAAPLRFEVATKAGPVSAPHDGRLFVILSRTNPPEPRLVLGRTGRGAPLAFARDLRGFVPGAVAALDQNAFGFPLAHLSALPAGDYFVQALFEADGELRLANGPGNLYSLSRKMHLDPNCSGTVRLELSRQVPPEELPPDSEHVRFIKLRSPLLSRFHGRPIFLRAGIVLPRDYEREPSRRYPLWVRIGGLNTRYTAVRRLMKRKSAFRAAWLADETPRFILLQLDGAGPYGDPYYVNSANNGPYGDALVRELIPQVEKKFRAIGQPRGRVLSGVSTGGWVALALQVFYPETFNGVWSACPDPVDFRALELVNIYADSNAYTNACGNERPSERNRDGNVVLTLRHEVGLENLLGGDNSFTLSGQQWGAWNAAFGPRGPHGLPVPLWDPQNGNLNPAAAEHWKQYDLRLVLERNWPTLAPKLQGKLHIAAGEADQYFLNNAVHRLGDFLARANPSFEGRIVYGPGKPHGWTDVSLPQMLAEMQAAVEAGLRKQ